MLLLALLTLTYGSLAVNARADFSTWTPPSDTAPSGSKHLVGSSAWTSWFKNNNPDLVRPVQPQITKCTGPTTNVWGASFDDGPWDGTPILLDYFDQIKMQATFWVVGESVVKHPDLLLRAYRSGHQIGIHSWLHPRLRELSDDDIIAELVYSARAVYAVIGVYPKYFRPPYGNADDRVRSVAALVGMTSVTWSKDSQDWQYVRSPSINASVASNFRSWLSSGSTLDISLHHDLEESEARAGITAMNMLLDAGRVIKPLSECIGDNTPYDNPILSRFFEASGLFSDHWGTNNYEHSIGPAVTGTALTATGSFNAFAAKATQSIPVAANAVVNPASKTSTAAALGASALLFSCLFLI
ncbi:chitin deacetylase [Chytriomyces hyalinus]|nr:chitin deacetylase [Chytriomyces hyalinus]